VFCEGEMVVQAVRGISRPQRAFCRGERVV